MARTYDGDHRKDIGHFEGGIEGRSVGKPVAVFHNSALDALPDPQVKLTPDELDARITWRKSHGCPVKEEEKAKAELDRWT